jgi:hypothetical protein
MLPQLTAKQNQRKQQRKGPTTTDQALDNHRKSSKNCSSCSVPFLLVGQQCLFCLLKNSFPFATKPGQQSCSHSFESSRPDRAEIRGNKRRKRILFSQRETTPRTYSQLYPIQSKPAVPWRTYTTRSGTTLLDHPLHSRGT